MRGGIENDGGMGGKYIGYVRADLGGYGGILQHKVIKYNNNQY